MLWDKEWKVFQVIMLPASWTVRVVLPLSFVLTSSGTKMGHIANINIGVQSLPLFSIRWMRRFLNLSEKSSEWGRFPIRRQVIK